MVTRGIRVVLFSHIILPFGVALSLEAEAQTDRNLSLVQHQVLTQHSFNFILVFTDGNDQRTVHLTFF